jgi:hypothetical protein
MDTSLNYARFMPYNKVIINGVSSAITRLAQGSIMYTQNKIKGFKNKSKIKRLMLSVFAVCFLASAALISVIAGEGGIPDGRSAYAAGDVHSDWIQYNSSGNSGDSPEAPYLIGNATQLKDLASYVNGVAPYSDAHNMSGKYIKLTADIDLSAYKNGAGWEPIGNYSTTSIYFAGDFDGGGFEVSNLYVINDSFSYLGLFGCLMNSTIKNLGVSGLVSVVMENGLYAGIIAGYIKGDITNSYSTGDISIPEWIIYCNVGGIAGYIEGDITGSYNTGNIWMYEAMHCNIGGIAGYIEGDITGSYNTGNIITEACDYNANIGGIAGLINSGSIEYSYNAGLVVTAVDNCTTTYTGGIAGYSGGSIKYSYNAGPVTATNNGDVYDRYTGGIAGYSGGSIKYSYNAGPVTATNNGTAYNCYTGGIAGYLGYNTIENCYYNNETFSGGGVGYGSQNGCTGRTTAQMTADDTLTAGGAMSGLGAAFEKRTNYEATEIAYYPELDVFKNSPNPAVREASEKTAVAAAPEEVDEGTDNGGGENGGENGGESEYGGDSGDETGGVEFGENDGEEI